MIQGGRVAQLIKCLATDACLTADPGIASLISVRSHTFMEIDYAILYMVIRVIVSYKRKYVLDILVNCLFKLAQEKCVVK